MTKTSCQNTYYQPQSCVGAELKCPTVANWEFHTLGF